MLRPVERRAGGLGGAPSFCPRKRAVALANHAGGAQLIDRGGGVAELGEQLLVVLANETGGALPLRRVRRDAREEAVHQPLAEVAVRDRHEPVARL